MLIDELREQLKLLEPDIQTIQSYWKNSGLDEKFLTITHQTEQPDFWQNTDQATILKNLQKIRSKRERYYSLIKTYKELLDLIELFGQDEKELKILAHDVSLFCESLKKFKIDLLLNNPQDSSDCFLSINAGAGGTESQDWAEMLLRMYTRFCEREKLTADLIDFQAGETAGIKSATLFIKGDHAYGLLKAEDGIHRLVRISPYDANKRRHTSFASISVTPEVPEIAITIEPQDLRIDTYRAGGAGGQHVNKTESAVRITHIPTNTVTQCQSQRSQTQNKETAMKMLIAKLAQKQKDELEAQLASIEKKKIEWGSQIRSYILHPYKLVKDHRTDTESPQPDLVLDGELMQFIESYLLQTASEKT